MGAPRVRERLPLLVLALYAFCLILLAGPVPAPEPLRAAAGVAAILVLPGAGIALLWPGLENRGWPAILAFAFPLSLLEVTGITLFGHFTGWPIPTLAAAALFGGFLGILLALLLAWRRERGGDPGGGPVLMGILAAAALLLLVSGAPLSPASDGPDHVTTVREILITGNLFPGEGLVADGEVERADPRKGILHVGLALAAASADASPVAVWHALPGMLAPSWLALVFILGLRLCGSRRGALIAVVLALLFLGGEGGRWAARVGYGAHAGLIVAWAALWTLLDLIEDLSASRLVLLGILAGVCAAVHALAPAFLFLPAGLLWIAGIRGPGPQRARLTAGVAVAVAIAAPVLAMRLLHARGADVNPLHRQVMPLLEVGDQLFILWPPAAWALLGAAGLLGLLLVPWAGRFVPDLWGRRFLGAASIGPILLTAVPGIFDIAAGLGSSLPIKTLYLVPFSWVLGAFLASGWRGRGVPIRIAVLGVLLLGAPEAVRGFTPEAVRGSRPAGAEELIAALNEIDGRVVVTGDPWISSLVAAETDHYPVTVFHQHGHPLDPAGLTRLNDLGVALSPWTDAAAAREVMRRYRSAYLVLPLASDAALEIDFGAARGGDLDADRLRKFESFPEGFEVVGRTGSWVLFRQRAGESPAPDPPRVAAIGDPRGVTVPAEDGEAVAVRLRAIEAPPRARAGDRVPVVCWWSGDGEPRTFGGPGWPPEIHLRLVREGTESGPRPLRLLEERLGSSPRRRVRLSTAPFEGAWPTGAWPGTPVADTLSLGIPPDLEPGTYTLSARVLPRPMFTRLSLRDLWSEQDQWQGKPLLRVEIAPAED